MVLKMLIPVLFIIFSGCSRYPVSGHIDMANSDKHPMLYMIEPQSFSTLASSFEGKVIDSAKIDGSGNFRFEKMPESAIQKIYLLTIQKVGEQYPNRLENDVIDSSNYLPFIHQSSKVIKIKSSAEQLLKYAEIGGNVKENDAISKLIKTRFQLVKNILAPHNEVNESNLMDREKATLQYQKELMSSLGENNDVLLHALALRWLNTAGDYERIPELVKFSCQKLKKATPNHPWTAQICKLSATLPLTPGDTFPDYPMPVMRGDTIPLYSMLGARLTLIDLWASWCAPCRYENKKTLVPLWEEFHKDGFEIIGYALDSSENGWNNAIKTDGADRWHHASHLNGDDSPLFRQLKISTIPANYLIGPDGTILAKNLHGDDMYQWVKTYLKK